MEEIVKNNHMSMLTKLSLSIVCLFVLTGCAGNGGPMLSATWKFPDTERSSNTFENKVSVEKDDDSYSFAAFEKALFSQSKKNSQMLEEEIDSVRRKVGVDSRRNSAVLKRAQAKRHQSNVQYLTEDVGVSELDAAEAMSKEESESLRSLDEEVADTLIQTSKDVVSFIKTNVNKLLKDTPEVSVDVESLSDSASETISDSTDSAAGIIEKGWSKLWN